MVTALLVGGPMDGTELVVPDARLVLEYQQVERQTDQRWDQALTILTIRYVLIVDLGSVARYEYES